LAVQSCAQLLESALQGADAGVFGVLDNQLIIATRRVQADTRPYADSRPILQRHAQQARPVLEQGATDLGLVILERKINMPRTWPGQVGYFALDPQQAEAVFQKFTRGLIELADTENGRGAIGNCHLAAEFRMSNLYNVRLCGGD